MSSDRRGVCKTGSRRKSDTTADRPVRNGANGVATVSSNDMPAADGVAIVSAIGDAVERTSSKESALIVRQVTPRRGSSKEAAEPGPVRQFTPRRSRTLSKLDGAEASTISVVVRVRPQLQKEMQEKDGLQTSIDGKALVVSDGRATKQFAFDQVFDSRANYGAQKVFFSMFGRDLVLQSLKGYNVCVFAYGHTGSGKTYTMVGDGGDYGPTIGGEGAGLLPRFLHDVFQAHEQSSDQKELRYSCEYYEIYNDQIRDLLAPSKMVAGERTRKVHVHPKHGVFVHGLTEGVVGSEEEVLALLNFGNQMRAVASTTMNARSSRSHSIFTFRFEHRIPAGVDSDGVCNNTEQAMPLESPRTGGGHVESTVLFVDLAGREDQTVSRNRAVQLREMCHINTSLFHLAHLITKISEGHVEHGSLTDFRNSKLTLVLSQALIGNSRTALVATVAPCLCYFEDSVSTLSFAQSVKKIQTRPVVNNKSSNTKAAELEAEVKYLQDELHKKHIRSSDLEQKLLDVQALLEYYKRSFKEMKNNSDEARRMREEMIARIGLHGSSAGQQAPRTPTGELEPFFTKLCDDPCLQGCCNYFLSRGSNGDQVRTLRIGSVPDGTDRNLVLQGVGVGPKMCEVRFGHVKGIEVEVLGQDGDDKRVLLNGRRLRHQDGPQRMEHNDCLIIGYSQGFRLVVPTREMMLVTGTHEAYALARSSISKLDMESAVLEIADEEGGQFKEAYSFMTQLSARAPENTVQAFLRALHCICPLVDEANLITKAIFGESGTHFRLHALTDVFDFEHDVPALVVCVLQNRKPLAKFRQGVTTVVHEHRRRNSSAASSDYASLPPHGASLGGGGGCSIEIDPNELLGVARHPLASAMGLDAHMRLGGGGDPMLYVWSVEKFLFRLHEFREIYQDGSEASDDFSATRRRLSTHPLSNPWQETTLAATKLLSEGMRQTTVGPMMAWQFFNHAAGAGSIWDGSTPAGSAAPTPRGRSGTPRSTAATLSAEAEVAARSVPSPVATAVAAAAAVAGCGVAAATAGDEASTGIGSGSVTALRWASVASEPRPPPRPQLPAAVPGAASSAQGSKPRVADDCGGGSKTGSPVMVPRLRLAGNTALEAPKGPPPVRVEQIVTGAKESEENAIGREVDDEDLDEDFESPRSPLPVPAAPPPSAAPVQLRAPPAPAWVAPWPVSAAMLAESGQNQGAWAHEQRGFRRLQSEEMTEPPLSARDSGTIVGGAESSQMPASPGAPPPPVPDAWGWMTRLPKPGVGSTSLADSRRGEVISPVSLLNSEVDCNVQMELTSLRREVGNLAEERDRLAGLLQGLLDRLGSPKRKADIFGVGGSSMGGAYAALAEAAQQWAGSNPRGHVDTANERSHTSMGHPVYTWQAPCLSPRVPAPQMPACSNAAGYHAWLAPSVVPHGSVQLPASSPRVRCPTFVAPPRPCSPSGTTHGSPPAGGGYLSPPLQAPSPPVVLTAWEPRAAQTRASRTSGGSPVVPPLALPKHAGVSSAVLPTTVLAEPCLEPPLTGRSTQLTARSTAGVHMVATPVVAATAAPQSARSARAERRQLRTPRTY